MEYLKGQPRDQMVLYATCLDEVVEEENAVRFIDVFVKSLDMEAIGFARQAREGRPSYDPADLLRLFIYGYMNRIRSSRDLEKACKRNLEVIWLLEGLRPDHNTINRFRKDNSRAIRRVFRQTVSIARNFDLIGGLLVAGDSTKLRAQNSKKNNFNQKKIDRHLAYIDKHLSEYENAMKKADGDDERDSIQKDIDNNHKRRKEYKSLEKQLEESGEKQISTSDPDSRHQIVRNNITEVSYTLQSTVDAKHCIPIDYKVTNANDKKAMGGMLRRAKSILRTTEFTALYDKGYHTGSEFKIADELEIKTLVAIPGIGRNSQAPDPNYNAENFAYDHKADTYQCPEGHTMKSNGTRYKGRNGTFKQYKTKACKGCPVKSLCTTAGVNGKIVQRTEYADHIEANAERMEACEGLYKQRQAIVEHPFGTIKRQWGFDHVMTKKSMKRASADVGLIFIAYNLKRIMNLIGMKELIEKLKKLVFGLKIILRALLMSLAAITINFTTRKTKTIKNYFWLNLLSLTG